MPSRFPAAETSNARSGISQRGRRPNTSDIAARSSAPLARELSSLFLPVRSKQEEEPASNRFPVSLAFQSREIRLPRNGN